MIGKTRPPEKSTSTGEPSIHCRLYALVFERVFTHVRPAIAGRY